MKTRHGLKKLLFLCLSCLLVFSVSCGKNYKNGKKVSVSVKTPPTVFFAEAEIYNPNCRIRLPMGISNGYASAEFGEIPTGQWQIVVRLKDSNGKLLYLGTSDAQVIDSKTATSEIKLVRSMETGGLRVIASVPYIPPPPSPVESGVSNISALPTAETQATQPEQESGKQSGQTQNSTIQKAGHLAFWSTFDSASNIMTSRIGPGGKILGKIEIVPTAGGFAAKSGSDDCRIQYPPETFRNLDAGCVQLSVKLEHDRPYKGPPHYYYFDSYDETSRLGFSCGMDNNGSVFFVVFHDGQSHAGKDSTWSAIQLDEKKPTHQKTGDTLRIAAVWDRNGINGTKHTMEIYINGILNNWSEAQFIGPLGSGVVNVLNHRPGRDDLHCHDAIDDMKIWDYAKTDFVRPLSLGK